ncbi:MAG TPA: hypothetical protein VML75_28965 [Kofleriaceae bacterium]|nr:hypothetical protein [Kofleriaceae bacterium]
MSSDKDKKIGAADTLPAGTTTEDLGLPPRSTQPVSNEIETDVVTADTGASHVHGSALLDEPSPRARIHEIRAREILDARFSAAGAALTHDYPLAEGDLAVTLDGFDPSRRIGYAFISHADADVITDFDEAAELALQGLADRGRCWVLVIHDRDIPNEDAIERRIDAFFDALHRSNTPTERG